jgi:zinc transport system substrate-binding protein
MPRLVHAALAALIATVLSGGTALAAPQVVVSIKPLHAIVAAVMGKAGEPRLLLDAVTSEHTAQLKPSQVEQLAHADLIVVVGGGLEAFLRSALDNPEIASRRLIEAAEIDGVRTLPLRTGGLWEVHAHGSEEHEHADADDQEESHGGVDPHVWMNPDNAKAIAAGIARELAAMDPPNAATYLDNSESFAAQTDKLVAELAQAVRPLQGKRYIVFHDAYQYFETRFGLDPAGSITVNPETPPGARRLAEIQARIIDTGATCVFAEPQFESKYVTTLVGATGVRTGVLDGLGVDLDPGPAAYPALLRRLVRDLAACLEG